MQRKKYYPQVKPKAVLLDLMPKLQARKAEQLPNVVYCPGCGELCYTDEGRENALKLEQALKEAGFPRKKEGAEK
jgi:hypothetical protein